MSNSQLLKVYLGDFLKSMGTPGEPENFASRRPAARLHGPCHFPGSPSRPPLEAIMEDITGTKTIGLHHDISALTGEEIVIFTLSGAPNFRSTTAGRSSR